jgi:hypothetical protein
MTVWIGETRTHAPLGEVLRTGAAFWLLGHGARLQLPDGTAALLPLGLSVLFALLASRAGAKVARVRPAAVRNRAVLGSGLAVGVPYAVTAALIAAVAGGGGLHVSAGSAALCSFALAVPAAAVGAWRELPSSRMVSGPVRAVAAGVAAAGAALIAVCALVAGIALLVHVTDAADLAKPARAGAVGGMGLLLLQAALAPNVMAWTGAYILGPGFAVGAGTIVGPSQVHLGALPGLPMLAGLPSGAAPWPAYILFVVPPAAGVLAGLITLRRLARPPSLRTAALCGLAIAGGVGLMAGLAAALSGGSVTSGRLETIGPSALPVGAFATLEVGVPALLTIVALTFYRTYWLRRPISADRPTIWARTRAVTGAAATAVASPFGRLRRGRGVDAEPQVVDLTKLDNPEDDHQTIDLSRELAPLADLDDEPADEVPLDAQDTQPLDLAGLAELVRAAEAADESEAVDEAEAVDEVEEAETTAEAPPVDSGEAKLHARRLLRLRRRNKPDVIELPD